jgi:glutamate/tyrosine decarboxylase-like PLP-dependent enzyme
VDPSAIGSNLLSKVSPRVAGVAERSLKRIPPVRRALERQYAKMLQGMEPRLKPYRGVVPGQTRLPATGLPRDEVLAEMDGLSAREDPAWREGFASGAVYQGDTEHIEFLNRVYALTSQANPLHSDLWPSITKYESEIVAMTAAMLGGDAAPTACGLVTSGGTESILMAMKSYRDWGRATRRVTHPEVVAPTTAHPAFDKAAESFGVRLVRVPVGPDLRADLAATGRAIGRNTVALVGSAPGFPHGVIDPIAELSDLARSRGLGFHTDACLGGFLLPWARRLGHPIPEFDLRLPGVTSMSADTHKFGYAAKGTSVVLFRTPELRRHAYFVSTDWPGGMYASPTLAGSRPGALIAACWAAMVTIGEDGYLDATKRILDAADRIRRGIGDIPELRIIGDPLWILAFASADPKVDVYRVLDHVSKRGWHLIGLQKPPAVHLVVTLRHAQPGVPERFVEDLREAVALAKAHRGEKGGMAPVYGMADTVPFRGVVDDMLRRYMDLIHQP